ncbi:MAG: penicillin-binding transpeptidase domain-containing protein, partial [Verrucomicrobiota bacterium]|nr:penicillin-binding transpeptidase domain-containing protein [Verrucomicrobiota bacterium]
WEQLIDDDTDPLTNRAIQSYAPGSTYKTVSALAGLRKGLTSRNAFTCSGGVHYGAKFMKCWIADKGGAHGTLALSEALKVSCNAFFYQWANAAGIDQINVVGDALMLGRKTGVPLSGESGGILPGPEWLRLVNPNDRWSSGRTANTGIGQGEVEASPLQMAMVIATIANRGVSYEPRLIHRVLSQDGQDARDEDGKLAAPPGAKVRADLRADGISKDEIELVRRGLWKVVNEAGGTGKRAQIKGVDVAGKTGTAQFWRLERGQRIKDNHTWFLSFAPYDQPRYAVCVFVQGAKSGGGVSAPIAQKILEECFAIENGWDPGLTALEPAKGSFAPIELVDYKKSAVPSEMKPDEETADHTDEPPAPAKMRDKRTTARPPTIRADADAAGRVQPRPPKPPVDRIGLLERFFGPRRRPVNNPPPRQSPSRPGAR